MGRDAVRGTFRTLYATGKRQKEAMKKVAKDRGISKRDVYQALLKKE